MFILIYTIILKDLPLNYVHNIKKKSDLHKENYKPK